MKPLKIFATALLLAWGLAGCGGGGGGTESASEDTRTVAMVAGRAYTVEEGDTIEKRSADTVVLVETDLHSGETTATLQSGSALLIRP